MFKILVYIGLSFCLRVCLISKWPKKFALKNDSPSIGESSDTWKNLDWRSCIKFSEVEIRKVSAWSGSAINRMSH